MLDNKSLVTVFQPMVDLRTGAVVGHEALIRTPRTVGEWTYEDLLLAAKEQHYQRQFELGCVEFAIEHFLADQPKGQLFVNISAYTLVQMQESGGTDAFLQILRKHKLQPKRMGLDITGYTRIPSVTTLIDAITPLRAAGMAVALDDFKVSDNSMRVWTQAAAQHCQSGRTLDAQCRYPDGKQRHVQQPGAPYPEPRLCVAGQIGRD
ncbi:MAG: EAL domain-containing protein [Gemmobacter sp.]|nr:EAL domain-containing protein [Gemmobacter sp.]